MNNKIKNTKKLQKLIEKGSIEEQIVIVQWFKITEITMELTKKMENIQEIIKFANEIIQKHIQKK